MKTYSYDDADRISSIINPEGDVTTYSYDVAGRRTMKQLANGTRASYTYNAAGKLTFLTDFKADSAVISSFAYTYSAVGNRTSVVEADGDRVTWTYDDTYQLLTEKRIGINAYAHTFMYDPVGNRLTKIEDGSTTTYTYDVANQLKTAQDSIGALTTYSYDAEGNQLSVEQPNGDLTTQTWSYENKLIGIEQPTAESFTYTYALVKRDNTEQRITKDDGTVFVRFVWDEDRILAELDDGGLPDAEYTLEPAAYGNLISQKRDTESSYYHYDALGNTRCLTDTAEVATDEYSYYAFGEPAASSGSTENDYQWVGEMGYYHDAESGLYLLRARPLRSETGRFLSEDPIRADEENLYRYVANNPINLIDPSGNIFVTKDKDEADEFAKKLMDFRGTQREDCNQKMQHVSVHKCCKWWYIHTDERDAILLSDYASQQGLGKEAYNQFMRASGATTYNCWEHKNNIVTPSWEAAEIGEKTLACIKKSWKANTEGYDLMPVKVDIGGEGKHLDAINLSPTNAKTSTFKEGDIVPRQYQGEDVDLATATCGATVDLVYIERTFGFVSPTKFGVAAREYIDDKPNGSGLIRILEQNPPPFTRIRNLIWFLNKDPNRPSDAKIVKIAEFSGVPYYYVYEIRFVTKADNSDHTKTRPELDWPKPVKSIEPAIAQKPDCKVKPAVAEKP